MKIKRNNNLIEIRLIDRGGFGTVHEVEMSDGRRLAKKSFDPIHVNPDDMIKLKKRFEREIRIQSLIKHPNIMPVVDCDLDASPPWFTMPLANHSFAHQIALDTQSGTIDPSPWQDILAAVEELHRLGYVHRDLKPQNILYLINRWVLSDFGLILPTARETTILTGTNTAFGSQYYAAPEQAQDFRNTPHQADIFALGCILHDSISTQPSRVPFAQIRIEGSYGPLLEKCTEIDYKTRFKDIATLRSALFDLWRSTQEPTPAPNDASLLSNVQENPNTSDAWRFLIGRMENAEDNVRDMILRGINGDLIKNLSNLDDVLFGRLVTLLCTWIKGSNFDWSYCDIVGDRLLEVYRNASVRINCAVVLAALELAVSHNRWHVMNQVGAMLSPAADGGLVDRILIEMGMNDSIVHSLIHIEDIVNWERDKWHPKIANVLADLG